MNIFKDYKKPLKFYSVGYHCRSPFCMNSSHFLSFGIIPDYKSPSYYELRNRKTCNGWDWINDEMKFIMSQKLYENNERDTNWETFHSSCVHYLYLIFSAIKELLPHTFKEKIKKLRLA